MAERPVAFVVQKIGPYHHARLNAAVVRGAITAIEFRPGDDVYAWAPVRAAARYTRLQVAPRELEATLDVVAPRVVVCTGYSDPEIQRVMLWAARTRTPVVVCSDSTRLDAGRSWWREALKRRLLDGVGAGFVAGRRAADYLAHLGVPADRQFQTLDVIDNTYFEAGAAAARSDRAKERHARGLPENYFLCVARMVPKKNLTGLLAAYHEYVRRAGREAWRLVLSGSGPLETELRSETERSGLAAAVHFAGFQQYPDLPAYYGLARAFVLPSFSDQWGLVVNEAMAAGLPVLVSDRCGCADDLIEGGVNGYAFDPADREDLVRRLVEISAATPERLEAMGRRSRAIIARYSLAGYADGFWAAVNCAGSRPLRPSLLSRVGLRLLSRRSA